MNAVATMTPDPKYLATKNAHAGTPTPLCLAANTGNHAPRNEPMNITKMADILIPNLPLCPFPLPHVESTISKTSPDKERLSRTVMTLSNHTEVKQTFPAGPMFVGGRRTQSAAKDSAKQMLENNLDGTRRLEISRETVEISQPQRQNSKSESIPLSLITYSSSCG